MCPVRNVEMLGQRGHSGEIRFWYDRLNPVPNMAAPSEANSFISRRLSLLATVVARGRISSLKVRG
jgi:hypothetical protein